MSLPAAWVDRIFEKLSLVYGRDFASRWEGLDIAAVKADWGHELAGLAQSSRSIAFALSNLPSDGKPPTVLQFRQLARSAPPPPRIEAPPSAPADPGRVADALAGMHRPGQQHPKAWAWKLKAREESDPKRLTAAQRDAWRATLQPELARDKRIHEDATASLHGAAA
jgi:hypothetical protein